MLLKKATAAARHPGAAKGARVEDEGAEYLDAAKEENQSDGEKSKNVGTESEAIHVFRGEENAPHAQKALRYESGLTRCRWRTAT
jgi:hypothetical protein